MDLFGDLPEPAVSSERDNGDSIKSMLHSNDNNSIGSSTKRNIGCLEDVVDSNSKKMATNMLRLKGYVAERKGEREEMQDAHTMIDDFLPDVDLQSANVSRLSFYAVFDGHGGKKASKYAAEHLHKIIAQKFPKGNVKEKSPSPLPLVRFVTVMSDGVNIEKDMKRCIIESFKKLDEDFLNEAKNKKPSWKDGTTVVSLIAVNNTLYIGNLGDSKATLCRYNTTSDKFIAVPLTTDHSPTMYEERMRIQKAGGNVREGRVMGILEVSRSIGDGSFKMHGVSCIPDVKKCQLTSDDRFVIIACDGLWKRFDNDSAIEYVNGVLEDVRIEATNGRDADDVRCETACNRLANEAVRRLSADNVTVLLVRIQQQQHSDSSDSSSS